MEFSFEETEWVLDQVHCLNGYFFASSSFALPKSASAACYVTPKARSSHGLLRGTIAEKDPRFFGPAPAAGGAAGFYLLIRLPKFGDARISDCSPN